MISNLLLMISWIFIVFGVIGFFRFSNLYSRLLISSKIDTVAFMTIIFALIARKGLSFFSLKLFIILVFILFTNPISSHYMTRSAYKNGIPLKKDR